MRLMKALLSYDSLNYMLYALGLDSGYTVAKGYTARSSIALCLMEFPRAQPEGTPEDKGLYLTVYPESSPNTDIILFQKIFRHYFCIVIQGWEIWDSQYFPS